MNDNDTDWILKHFKADYKYGAKKKDRSWGKKKADDALFACPKCSMVFEYVRLSKGYNYYEDFPTYGKKKKECPKCENQ